MKKLFFAIIALSISLFAVTTFEKNLGAEWDDHGNSVYQTYDGGYIFAGSMIDSLDYIYSTLTLTKINSFGDMEWKNSIGASSFIPIEGHCVVDTNDGNYVIAGSTGAIVHGCITSKACVAKTDTEGNILWRYQDINDGQFGSVAFNIAQTGDNGYILICEDSPSNFPHDLIIKLDFDGKEMWRKYDYDYSYSTKNGRSILQTNEGSYAFISTTEDESGNVVPILVKADSLGNETWIKTYPGLFSYSMGYSLKNTSDDGFVIFGMTDQESYGNLARLIKTDVNGEMLWEKSYGILENTQENTVGRSLDITADGGFILAGYTENISSGLADAWLIKTDSEGNEIWEKTYGREGDDRFHSVQQTLDGGYILAGYTDSFGYGGTDMWIIKTDENGTEIESPFLPQTTELFQNFPNPFNPVTSISYALSQAGQVELSVYNLNGQLVKRLVDGKQEKGANKVEFDAGDLTSGLFIYSLKVDGRTVQSRKMMLLK
jgi:hypothetical protein